MTIKGNVVYVPPVVRAELDNIKKEDEIEKTSEAFKKMVKDSIVGREMKKIGRMGIFAKR